MNNPQSRTRKRKQGNLTLSAVFILLILILGVFFFVLVKILGGSMEVSNATDAGILNVARNALTQIGVKVPDDLKHVIAPDTEVTLHNYNRLVGQALLVGLNAKTLGTDSEANAKLMVEEVKEIGKQLKKKINESGTLENWFIAMSHKNNTKMWNGNKVNAQTIDVLALQKGGSTNLTLSDNLPDEAEDLPQSKKPGAVKYLAGYVPLKFGLMGVPVFPGQKPHLVDASEPLELDDDVPGNAFRVKSVAKEGNTGYMGGSLSAAIVGCVDTSSDFPVSIPAGYIEINNLEGRELPSAWETVANDDNLYNNELFFPPGITAAGPVSGEASDDAGWSSVGFPGIFSQDEAAIRALHSWAITGGDTPLPSSYSYPVYIIYHEDQKGQPLSCPPTEEQKKDLRKMGVLMKEHANKIGIADATMCRNCLDDLQEKDGLRHSCRAYLKSMGKTYHPLPKEGEPYPDIKMFSAVDFVKGKVIHNFQQGKGSTKEKQVHIALSKTTGLGKFPRTTKDPEPTPTEPLPLQREGSILQLIDQVAEGDCNKDHLLKKLLQRTKEINPKTTMSQLLAMLNTKLPMGKTLYIYAPTPNANVIISEIKPPSYSGLVPDGKKEAMPCEHEYPLDDVFVNTSAVHPRNTHKIGDDFVRVKVFMKQEGGFTGMDRAKFKLSSGYGNLLGRLEFSNHAEGEAEYWMPN